MNVNGAVLRVDAPDTLRPTREIVLHLLVDLTGLVCFTDNLDHESGNFGEVLVAIPGDAGELLRRDVNAVGTANHVGIIGDGKVYAQFTAADAPYQCVAYAEALLRLPAQRGRAIVHIAIDRREDSNLNKAVHPFRR